METFKEVKRKFKAGISEILKKTNNAELDEAAFPAYAHKNPFIDYLFWKRLRLAFRFAQKYSTGQRVLDFGCGSGVMSYLLAKNNFEVWASDLEFSPLRMISSGIDFPPNIRFIEGDIMSKSLESNSFDIVFALDVLEHIENYPDYVRLFNRLLRDRGIAVISGPSENWLYRIGRKIAGKRFTGDYHVINIAAINESFKEGYEIICLKKLVFPFVLFEIFVARKIETPS
ncbi:MAG TPA: class I SAM-dependent methyltransferase [Bacteroidales bacterium]|nr:class I SAM-dependent methyltransferase [Bacteroidales bacterium]HQL70333.1 class I SAM-dependent methyltransferase [Bacteroidales bacterium]